MQFKTGTGAVISRMTVIALWSLSLGVDLPGLAVTPMLDRLDSIFPHASELEVQLLTVLPNLMIIPFVLLSGRLSMSRHKMVVIISGIVLYVVCAVWYMLSSSIDELIVISSLLGCACGLILPFSTGLIANVFTGSYRVTQMGIVSGIGNGALVVATFFVGYLASMAWHLRQEWQACVRRVLCLADSQAVGKLFFLYVRVERDTLLRALSDDPGPS